MAQQLEVEYLCTAFHLHKVPEEVKACQNGHPGFTEVPLERHAWRPFDSRTHRCVRCGMLCKFASGCPYWWEGGGEIPMRCPGPLGGTGWNQYSAEVLEALR